MRQGRYTLETIVPGEYPGRTQHIHVKVQAPNGPILTTQIYFPGVAGATIAIRSSIRRCWLTCKIPPTAKWRPSILW